MTTQNIIEKICEKTGHPEVEQIMNFHSYLKEHFLVRNADLWLRGWLTFPETLKAVFGEKDTCFICGGQEVDAGKSFDGEVTEYNPTCKKCGVNWMDKAEFPEEGNYIPAWEWHGQQMVYPPLEEILQHYEQHFT